MGSKSGKKAYIWAQFPIGGSPYFVCCSCTREHNISANTSSYSVANTLALIHVFTFASLSLPATCALIWLPFHFHSAAVGHTPRPPLFSNRIQMIYQKRFFLLATQI